MRAFCQQTAFKLGLHLLFPGSLAYWSTLKMLMCQPPYHVNQFLKIKLLINLQLNTHTHKYRSFTQILSNKMVKFYFILCNQFLKSFWSLLWVLYGFLSCLDLRDACRSHLYTQLLARDFKELTGLLLPSLFHFTRDRVSSPINMHSPQQPGA